MQALVPKNRKPKFDLLLRIIDLNNIPLVCGTCSVKWHLPSSITAEHRGRTEKAVIREHKASWDYVKTQSVRLTIDKAQKLQEYEIHFEVTQEYNEGAKGRVLLGNVKLNLAEYVNASDFDDTQRDRDDNTDIDSDDLNAGGIVRRYLMQDSKVNSTLKIGIEMKQTEGDTDFVAPPLKQATVFGGIAGIVSTEPGAAEGEDIPSVSSKTRELTELQDVYRRNLAANWACMAHELPPDKLIEDLFAGGNGGLMGPPPPPAPASSSRMNPIRQLQSQHAGMPPSTAPTQAGDHDSAYPSSDGESRRYGSQHLSPNSAQRQFSGASGNTNRSSLRPIQASPRNSSSEYPHAHPSETTAPSPSSPTHRRYVGSRNNSQNTPYGFPDNTSGSGGSSGSTASSTSTVTGNNGGGSGTTASGLPTGVSGRASIDQQIQQHQQIHHHPEHSRMTSGGHHLARRSGGGGYREVTEFEVREDLQSWSIRAR